MITVKRKVQLGRSAHGQRRITAATADDAPVEQGRVPRISRLMALAIRLERLLRTGEISDVMELARLGHVTQPRVSQILNLTLLAPDIQEALLFLPRVTGGKAPIHEKLLRPIAAETDWAKQRKSWENLPGAGGQN
ncbi:MAG TPA: hypothetical protein VHX65_14480 [Pirellulales bacterium]|jgi:hypothetical protein|nr:hypothetical protein [Pirellulales bacterium]